MKSLVWKFNSHFRNWYFSDDGGISWYVEGTYGKHHENNTCKVKASLL